jgi:hypothetical protein
MELIQRSMRQRHTIPSKTGLRSRSVSQCLYGASGKVCRFCFVQITKLPGWSRRLGAGGHEHKSPETLLREGDNRIKPVRISFNEIEAYDQRNDMGRGKNKRKVK